MTIADAPPSAPAEVALEALTKAGERAIVGPSLAPRLVRVAPFPAEGPAMVFVHGIGGDPCNQWCLIREAQARGARVWTMAYETWKRGAGANAAGFAAELRALAAGGEPEITLVAHSLGALTAKGALDRLRRPDGHLEGFTRLRFVALSAPWAGVTAADLARHLFTGAEGLAFARDLAPSSPYWRGIASTPLAPEVAFYSLSGTWDSYHAMTWSAAGVAEQAALLAQARRHDHLPRGTHNAPNWDPRALAFVFDPDAAPPLASQPKPNGWRMALREVAATIGLPWAFRDPGE